MKVNQNLVSESKYGIKCPYEMTAEFIVVHNTANDAPATNEIAYMIRNNNEVSFHFAVDDNEIWQGIPLNRNSWNAGDGSNGKGNRKGISIEICYSKSGGERFDKAENLTSEFIAHLLNERGWGIDKVTKHQDYSKKYCPHRTLDYGWERFLKMIQAHLDELNKSDLGKIYRVQVGAFSKKENAEDLANRLKADGYDAIIVEAEGKVEEPKVETFAPYNVKVNTTDGLNIRKGAGTSYGKSGALKNNTVVTIVGEATDNTGMLWGELSDGRGWIALKYCVKV